MAPRVWSHNVVTRRNRILWFSGLSVRLPRTRPLPFLWFYVPSAIVVGILPVALVFAAWWSWENHSVVTNGLYEQRATVKAFAAFQQVRSEQRLQVLEAFARTLEAKRLIGRPGALQEELDNSRVLTGALGTFVADSHGTVVAFSPVVGPDGKRTIGHSYADRPYFKDLMTSGRTGVSTLFLGRQLKRPNVIFVTPIRDAGRIVGVLGMGFDVSSFAAGLVAHTPSPLGRMFLLDRTNTALRLDHGRRETILENWERSPLGNLPLETGGSRVMAVGAQTKLVSWEPVPVLRMVVGIEVGRDERLAAGQSAIGRQVLLAGAATILLIAAVCLVGGRLATRQLRRLGAHLRSLADGTAAPDAGFPAPRIKELAAVAADAEFMARTVGQRQREIEVLYRLDQELAAATRSEEIYRIGVEQAVQVLGFDAGVVFLVDERRPTLRLAHAYHVSTPTLAHIETLPIGSGAAGRAVAERRAIQVSIDDYPGGEALHSFKTIRDAGIRTLMSAPMVAHAEVYGAITIATRTSVPDGARSLALLGSIATQVAVAVAHARDRDHAMAQERMAAVGRLASGIAHELRNPLTVIAGRVQLLQRADGGTRSEALSPHVPALAEATARMRRIVDGLSTYSKPAAAESTPLDVADLVAATSGLITAEAKKRNVVVKVETPAGLPPVLGDRSEMMQILLNLATNAVEAMAETGGMLRIGARVEAASGPTGDAFSPARLIVEISDTGPGISPERMTEIWEPFVTTKPDGTGLGLSIVRSLAAKQPGATITVESTEGKGTTFRLTMPAAQWRAMTTP